MRGKTNEKTNTDLPLLHNISLANKSSVRLVLFVCDLNWWNAEWNALGVRNDNGIDGLL